MQQSIAESVSTDQNLDPELTALIQRARKLDPRLAKLVAAYGSLRRDAVKQTLTDFLVEFTKSENRPLE